MKKNHIIVTLILTLSLIPNMTFAALDGVRGLLTATKSLLNSVVPVLLLLSVIYFFWGIGQFILHDAGNDKTREEGKKKILWGIIALFVFVSLYGILNWIGNTIGIPVGGAPQDECLPGTCYSGGVCVPCAE